MDSHFEVILERVKQLTEDTGKVVWFEIPDTKNNFPVLVLINDHGKIGMITVMYKSKDVEIISYKLTKEQYDSLTEQRYTLESISQCNIKQVDTVKVIKWVVDN